MVDAVVYNSFVVYNTVPYHNLSYCPIYRYSSFSHTEKSKDFYKVILEEMSVFREEILSVILRSTFL